MPKTKSNDIKNTNNIESVHTAIEKKFGEGAIMQFGKKNKSFVLDAVSTGVLALDYALGIGGVPVGRIVEIFGMESSGKTTLALKIAAEFQKKGGHVVFIDAEHSLDLHYFQSLGIIPSKLSIAQPKSGEEGLEIADMILRSGTVGLIIIDSVAALTPRAEIDGEIGAHVIGLQSRMMSQACRKFTALAHSANTTIIFINQIRNKIGGSVFGSNETTAGGNALKFYSSVRLDVRRKMSLTGASVEDKIGHTIRIKVVKSKVSIPHKIAEYDLIYGNDMVSGIIDLLKVAIQHKVIELSGSKTYTYKNSHITRQGRPYAIRALQKDPTLLSDIKQDVYHAMSAVERDDVILEENATDDESINESVTLAD